MGKRTWRTAMSGENICKKAHCCSSKADVIPDEVMVLYHC